MSQSSRPYQDVSNSGWTPQVVNDQINGPPYDETFVTSSQSPEGDTFVVKLQGLAYPDLAAGAPTLTVRLRQTGTDAVPVFVLLLQGDQTIAGRSFQPTQSFEYYVMTLTSGEIARITNYADLSVQVTAGNSVEVTCCPNELPLVLTATVSEAEDDFACLPQTSTLTWDESLNQWVSNPTGFCLGTGCAQGVDLGPWILYCRFDSTWVLFANINNNLFPATSVSCDPLSLVFEIEGFSPTCSGSCTVTITK
jgi:hypothetical protein